jgi:uncharacterized protein YbcC (UPF0753/DUF2309 family)
MKTQIKEVNSQENINISNLIESAAEIIAKYYPLKNFIATNPLSDLEKLPFHEALRLSHSFYGASGYPSKETCIKAFERNLITYEQLRKSFKLNISDFPHTISEADNIINLHQLLWEKLTHLESQKQNDQANMIHEKINIEVIKYLAAFLDEGQAMWPMPNRNLGFFNTWRYLNGLELNISAEEAIIERLSDLNIGYEQLEDYIRYHFAALPGWTAFIKWREKQTDYNWQKNAPISLMDYLAVRLSIEERIILKNQNSTNNYLNLTNKKRRLEGYFEKFDEFLQGKIWLEAWEETYRSSLIKDLTNNLTKENNDIQPTDAQLVFCIDVRSEPYRRSIESIGNYNTYGFAGFFGLPISIERSNCDEQISLCPVLLKPKHSFASVSKVTILSKLKFAFLTLKRNIATSFSFVESIGLMCGIVAATKTLAPGKLLGQQKPRLHHIKHDEISFWDKVNYAYSLLVSIGVTDNFAKIVVLCGHGSSTVNNPYSSALDCGACGGNHGDINANLMADILNDKHVRLQLEDKNINIPEDTVFLGALHNTTTDKVTIFDNNVPSLGLIEKLKQDLILATRLTRKQKANSFEDNYKNRHDDIAQTRPEWGLARNASFIIAPRTLTKNIDLEGRSFLHSYDHMLDDDGSILTTILTAPMVVAQMINMQYYFSTVDNVTYGSGSKITHNIVGKIGIMQGNGSDLMHGLPLQSVMSKDEQIFHEPLRLTTIVYAPRSRINEVVAKQEILRKLFFNEWVKLVAIEPESNEVFSLNKNGHWDKFEYFS